MNTISLAELRETTALLTRVDRKYLLPVTALGDFAGRIAASTRVLQIAGQSRFGYQSCYYDSPELLCYQQAGRGRRRRFKIRTREYLHQQDSWLEVKARGARGTTVKDRLIRAAPGPLTLTEHGWLIRALQARNIPTAPVLRLIPVLHTSYTRRTLQVPPTPDEPASRLTIDTGLRLELPPHAPGGQLTLDLPQLVIVETKGAPRASRIDRLLWSMGYRPRSFSKYGVGIASLRLDQSPLKWHSLVEHQLAA